MPGKQARALCPVCQEPMPPDETECRNCGAFVIDEAVVRLCRALGIDRAKALALFEAGFRTPNQLKDRDVNRVLEKHESGLLFLCTNCGSFVATGDPKCGRCGAEFEPEVPAWSESDEDILDLVLCPNCGADNGPEWAECEICGEPLHAAEPAAAPAPPRPGPAPPLEIEPRPEPVPEPAPVPRDRPDEQDELDGLLTDLETILESAEAAPPERPATRSAPQRAETSPAPPATSSRQPTRPAAGTPTPQPVPGVAPVRAAAPPTPRGKTDTPLPVPAAPTREPPKARPSGLEHTAPSRVPPAATRSTASPEPSPRRPVRQPADIRVRPRDAPAKAPAAPVLTARDLLGPAVAAAGLSLVATRATGVAWTAWGIAFLLAALAGYGIAGSWPRLVRLHRVDAGLLLAGSVLGAAAPVLASAGLGVPDAGTAGLGVAAALPLALATRRLLAGPSRALLAAAAAVPMTALAASVGEGVAYAATDAWLVSLVALLPWPCALAVSEVRRRATTFAIRKELGEAERHYAREDYTRSVEDYDRAIRLDRDGAGRHDLPWYGKGAALVILGRYEEALVAIDRALDINPHNEVAWVNKGNALSKMGRLVDALRSFNAAIKVNPSYEVAWNNKGNALARLGHHEDALRCYEKALDLDPDYRGAWVNKGYVLAKLGRYDEAAVCADRVLRLGETVRVGPA